LYPELFRIPGIGVPITSFGPMLALAFLVGLAIRVRGMKEKGYESDPVITSWMYAVVGGVLGSKLYFAVDNWILYGQPFSQLFFARGGITWYGGLIGGTLAGAIGAYRHGLSIRDLANCAAPAAAVGQALGRIGCFLVGDDYGRASDVPWAIAFPEGAPPTLETVHPTQLYECAWLLPVALLLWSRRNRSPFLFGEYIALNGLGRIVIENWRVNPEVALGLTEPQWIGVALVSLGISSWLYFRFSPQAVQR